MIVASSTGIIPAYAGSTAGVQRNLVGFRDHPRIRGEHYLYHSCQFPILGSSPHTRGAQQPDGVIPDAAGIIPAYAGSTLGWPCTAPRVRDHPRIRGEHLEVARLMTTGKGSSPHTRGAPVDAGFVVARKGIIPAYAGSTLFSSSFFTPERDHPRIRGEHSSSRNRSHSGAGSSPHTRGAPGALLAGERERGIIPAYAGSTPSPSSVFAPSGDHPRIRGEHASSRNLAISCVGSSPHTRGARYNRHQNRPSYGIIPAYAGSTSSRRG